LRDPSPVIVIADLRKIFRVPVREAGLRSAVRSLVRREHRDVPAVDGISFEIAPGEVVATKRSVHVGTASGAVQLGEVQPQGKKPMAAADWARGVRIEPGEVLGR
jgi:methionyl-tRNA formyltransferase